MAGTTRRSFGRIEKRTSGRYRAAYVGPDGRLYRAPLTFDAKNDATAWLSARRAEIEMDVWAPSCGRRRCREEVDSDVRAIRRALADQSQDPGARAEASHQGALPVSPG